MDPDVAKVVAWVDRVTTEMDGLSYYQLLGLPPEATEAQVREAYYRAAARLHPDLFGDALDAAARTKLVTVYSRIVEAYRCLVNGERREQYDKLLAQGKLRVGFKEERAPRRDVVEEEIAAASARRFFKLGQVALAAGDGKGAVMNFKLALSVEPNNVLILSELAKAEALAQRQGGA